MLESFFVQKQVLDRLRSSPMGSHLPDLAAQLAQQHYARRTGCILLRTADRLGRWLAQQGVAPADATTIHLQSFVASQNRGNTGRLPQVVCGVWRIAELLQPRGLLNCASTPDAVDQWLQRFDQHLLSVHGLTAKTRDNYLRYARRFISERFRDVTLDWQTLSATDLCRFVQTEAARLHAGSGGLPGTAISAMLRFLATEGLVSPLLARALPHVRRWRHASLPRHLSSTQLETILAVCLKPEGGSCRDRAIVLLLARLGLRAGEVRQLQLQNIDWAEGVLYIRQGKSRRERCLPLPADAGTVLVDYFRQERPTSVHREVFLSVATPHRPLAASPAVSRIVQRVLRKVGIDAPRLGAHHLRHTTATQMVRRGTSFKDIADVLGHKSLDTTAIYAKLDEPSLQVRTGHEPSALTVSYLDAPAILAFLENLEAVRSNAVCSRNARLSAIRSFFRVVALRDPASLNIVTSVLAIPVKRTEKRLVGYLTRPEMDAMLAAPDQTGCLGTARSRIAADHV